MTNNIYYLTDDTTIHVYEGMSCMGIYDKENGIPKFVEKPEWKAINLDEEWAKNRNSEIEKEVEQLREQISIFAMYYSDKWEHIEAIEDLIKDLLKERDENTFKYGLAGEEFNRVYEEKKKCAESEIVIDEKDDKVPTFSTGFHRLDNELRNVESVHTSGLDSDGGFLRVKFSPEVNFELDGEDRDGDIVMGPNYKEAQFRKITSQMLELYLRKNTDYGDAFKESLDEDGLLVSKIRMNDKFKRFSQLINNDALIDDESIEDTLIDLANYTVMTLMWMRDNE